MSASCERSSVPHETQRKSAHADFELIDLERLDQLIVGSEVSPSTRLLRSLRA